MSRVPPIQTSMKTSLSLIKGEVLEYLEKRGLSTQDQILDEMDWPSMLVTLALGELIKDGIVRAKKFNGQLVIFESPQGNQMPIKKTAARNQKPVLEMASGA